MIETRKLISRDVVMVAVCGLIIRAIGCVIGQKTQPAMTADAFYAYLPIARSVHAGTGFQVGGSAIAASRIAPLYPVWLSGLMTFGGPDLPLWLIGAGNVALRVLGVVCVYLFAREYFGRRAAVATAALYIIDPWEAFWVGFVLKESLAVPLLLVGVLTLAWAAKQPSRNRYLIVGIVAGLATLARFASGLLVIAGIIVAFRARDGDRSARRGLYLAAILCLGFVTATSPWLIRNWRVLGEPVLTPSFIGRKLFTSNGAGVPVETDGYYSPPGMPSVANLNVHDTNPTEVEVRLAKLTLAHMVTHPWELAQRTASKVVNMWRPTFAESSRRNTLLLGGSYVAMMLISFAGFVIAIRRRIPAPALYATLVVFLCAHLVFRGEIRNRQYLTPMFYVFGGIALAALRAPVTRRAFARG